MSSNSIVSNKSLPNNQHQAFKHLRQLYPHLDMRLLATVTPWPEEKLASLFALWFPKRLSQHSSLYHQSNPHCYLCGKSKKAGEALDITCKLCFEQLLCTLANHAMVYKDWNPFAEALFAKYLQGDRGGSALLEDNLEAAFALANQPLASPSKPSNWHTTKPNTPTDTTEVNTWVKSWLAATEPAPLPLHTNANQPLKHVGFIL